MVSGERPCLPSLWVFAGWKRQRWGPRTRTETVHRRRGGTFPYFSAPGLLSVVDGGILPAARKDVRRTKATRWKQRAVKGVSPESNNVKRQSDNCCGRAGADRR